ncbi:hypothetical protein M758_7G026200 [Ceratodon purpureus]|nr:hypothetical protein M758_7G026200 [Ceratodon purpureus]
MSATTRGCTMIEEQGRMELQPNRCLWSAEYGTALASDSCTPGDGVAASRSISIPSSSSSSSSSSPSSSVYHSARIERMIESRNLFCDEVEFEIESSKVHWSELSSTYHDPENDRKHFEVLKGHPQSGGFFREFEGLVVGKKIGEGAQAEIYEAGPIVDINDDLVLKVMKGGCPLQSLQRQWPCGMLKNFLASHLGPLSYIAGGTLMKDERLKNRFAFVMLRKWGDLRKLIDLRKLRNKNKQVPPFTIKQVKRLMLYTAMDMEILHEKHDIIHRDIKASNVLVFTSSTKMARFLEQDEEIVINAHVADFECSLGVVGTGFWRAPEILQQLKDGISSSHVKFTPKSDVYSYGMLCYEIVTGSIPFDGQAFSYYDLVLGGQRPVLPCGLDHAVKDIIVRCWHPDPTLRPNFHDIAVQLNDTGRWYSSFSQLPPVP